MFYIEVKMKGFCKCGCGSIRFTWNKVKPTGGKPYQFESVAEAFSTLNMCYPDSVYGDSVRITNDLEEVQNV